MSIEVIGAGMGRTGTLSMKHALEMLGYHKTHHMFELMINPPQLPYWKQLHQTRSTDFDTLLAGYTAIVDFPGALYYKELMKKYPDAKVILTARDPEKWYKSVSDTIFNYPKGFEKFMMQTVGMFKPEVKHIYNTIEYAKEAIWFGLFERRFADKQFALDIYNQWNDDVLRTVPKEKLLVFNVQDGWEPLCAFLNKPVPDASFPRVNDTKEFNDRKKKMSTSGVK
jgi:hypothetical protein